MMQFLLSHNLLLSLLFFILPVLIPVFHGCLTKKVYIFAANKPLWKKKLSQMRSYFTFY